MSKKVTIRRKISFAEGANKDPNVREYINAAYRAVGSYFKQFGRVYGTGLTRKEEELLMPYIIGLPADDKGFYMAVQDYFKNINTKIPGEGLPLEIGLMDDSKDLSKENMPLNIDQYVRYRHIKGHPQTASSLEEAESLQHIRIYIDDEEVRTATATKLNKRQDEATIAYLRVINNEDQMDQVLTLLGTIPLRLTADEKILKLKEYSSVDAEGTDMRNEEKLEKFIRISYDKNLAIKYEILDMIRCSILERVGMKILIKESGDVIGNNLDEAVLWMKDKSKSPEVNVLRAKHDEFGGRNRPVRKKEAAETAAQENKE